MQSLCRKTCLLSALVCHQAIGVDFKTHYLARTADPSAEFSLLLHLYQTQLNASLTTSYYHRFLLHSLLDLPPHRLPDMLALPPPLTVPHDEWAMRERIPRADLLHAAFAQAREQEHEPWPEHLDRHTLQALLSSRINQRGKHDHLHTHLAAAQAMRHDDRATHTSAHLLVRAVLQVLWRESLRLQKLQGLAQRMPTARRYGVAQQRQASALLRTLVLDAGKVRELQLSNAERGMLEQLERDQQRQRRVQQALSVGGALAVALLLSRGAGRLRALDVRALWSKRVLGMHLGYSVTTLAALYPAWQLSKAVKRRVMRVLRTPADLRLQSDYRIAYLAFLANPRNLQHQQQMLHTLNRCLQRLPALFAQRDLSIKVNAQHHRYRIVREAERLSIAVPYSASSDVALALEQVIAHYYEGTWVPQVLPPNLTYCHRDRV